MQIEDSKEIQVILSIQDKNWVINLQGSLPPGFTYAFYLLRNGVRVAHRWYEKSQTTEFENDGVAGSYQAKAFIKQENTIGDPKITTLNSSSVMQDGPPYDLRRWNHIPLFVNNFADSWNAEVLSDGLYQFKEDNLHIDFLLTGMEKIEKSSAVLVCFGGAVSSRSGTSAPFFSGGGISKRLDVPVISIADPSLGLSNQLTLGWYVGFQGFQDLPFRIAFLLDAFSEKIGKPLIIFGGSGGGFASLLILNLLKTEYASAFVWNPQTSISRYGPNAVKRFLETSFPKLSSSGDLRSLLEACGVQHDLTSPEFVLNLNKKVLYIQNGSDWHTVAHAKPFFSRFTSAERKSKEVVEYHKNFVYWEGHWGEGHASPPMEIVELALNEFILGSSVSDIALNLEKNSVAIDSRIPPQPYS